MVSGYLKKYCFSVWHITSYGLVTYVWSLHRIRALQLKGPGSRLSSSIVRPYSLWTSALVKKLIVNNKITASRKTNGSPEHYIKHCKQQKWTLKNCQVKKFSKTHNFNPFQSSSSLSIRAYVCICYVINNFLIFRAIISMFSHSIWCEFLPLEFR